MFREIEHTADLALQIKSKTFTGLLEDAAKGMFYLIFGEILNLQAEEKKELFRINLKNYFFDNCD